MADPVAKKFREDADKETAKNESAGQKIESGHHFRLGLTYDVVRLIFKFLNGKDLASAASVCRCWRDAATNEFKTRGPLYLRKNVDTNNALSDHYMDRNIVDSLRIKPKLGILFTGDFESSVFDSLKVSDCYCSQLPPFCDTLMLRTYGAVLDEIELDKKDIACVFIPIIPKMKINTFFIDATQGTANHKNMSAKVQDWIAKNSGFGKNEKSKCVMVFSDGDNYTLATKILESIKYKYPKQNLSLIGGIVKNIVYCQNAHEQTFCKKSATLTVVTLSGPDLKTWSIIISKNCCEEEQIEQKLKCLREKIHLKKFSMGFMFSCCERIDGQKMETRVFKKVFPEVPLAGGFGGGEFGENTIKDPASPKEKATRSYLQTTIFMILTYG